MSRRQHSTKQRPHPHRPKPPERRDKPQASANRLLAEQTRKILRKPSAEIESILGYVDEPELIHRDNLVLL